MGMAQVVECLPSKFKAPCSNPSIKKKLLGPRWLMPIILVTWEAEIEKDHGSRPAQANSARDPIWVSQPRCNMDWRCSSRSRAPAL
jgi:hypothetical protein